MNDWIFLSHILNEETPVYGGRTGLQLEVTSSISSGCTANSIRFSLPNHFGTHLDLPRHFFEDGQCLDDYDANFWQFKNIFLFDCEKKPGELVSDKDFGTSSVDVLKQADCLFIKTGFEKFRQNRLYWENNPGLHPDLGFFLREYYPNIRLVGIDVISISRWQDRETGRKAHRAFLDPKGRNQPIILIEDMSFFQLGGRSLQEVCIAPLRVARADGAPCTILGRF